MTIRRLIYFSDRAAGLLGTISSSTVNAAIEKAYGAPEPQQPEQEPFWYAVVSEQAPTINSAIKRLDVAQEFADSKRERWPDTRVVPLYTTPQSEQNGLDAKRMEWMLAERCIIESQNGIGSPTVYRVVWRSLGEAQSEWYPTEREAIDHARGGRHE